jgi:phosphate starvation-inducible PhoH-like protein
VKSRAPSPRRELADLRDPGTSRQKTYDKSSNDKTSHEKPWSDTRVKPAEIVLEFDDNKLASALFGRHAENLALIERRLGVVADQRGNKVTLEGEAEACQQARRALAALYKQLKGGHHITHGDVEGAIRQVMHQVTHQMTHAPSHDAESGGHGHFAEMRLRKRLVRARTAGQDKYMRALSNNTLVFGSGPAGTGKTWLAVAHAVHLFERREVDRIVLSRPAVEAGERLGFLPGDMREKVDPYLRPIYDAFFDLMDRGIFERALQSGDIEIAPLAFMRGRTLANAAVILDEAQNTTSMQMKMFLTRLGENSRMMVTGDPSQIDLPPGQKSGLVEALSVLPGLADIAHVPFDASDVVRHELVSRIVTAYDAAASKPAVKP